MGWGFPWVASFHLRDESVRSVLLLFHFPEEVEAAEAQRGTPEVPHEGTRLPTALLALVGLR